MSCYRSGDTIRITQGQTYSEDCQLLDSNDDPIDISDFEFAGQIREKAESATEISEFTFTVTDASEGKFRASLTSEQTAGFPVLESITAAKRVKQVVFDWFAYLSDDRKWHIRDGIIEITPRVTKDE